MDNLTEKQKTKIDNMSYHAMLDLYRFAPAGDKMFQGESGDYFINNMNEKKNLLSHNETVSISKAVGWENV